MNPLRFTLVADGASDRALLPVLDWLLHTHSARAFQSQWADLRALPRPPQTLHDRLRIALQLFPCDLLFVHRDAERQGREIRVQEILSCVGETPDPPIVCVIPVRMQEAWFLFDETWLRFAAGNPNGRMPLALPPLDRIEEIPNPKELVHDLLRTASGLRPGRLRRFQAATLVHRLTELIDDWSPLRRLPAFLALEDDVRALLADKAWL